MPLTPPPAGAKPDKPDAVATRPSLSSRARAGGARKRSDRRSPALLVAVGVHIVVALVAVQVFTLGRGIPFWLRFGTHDLPVEDRLTYVLPRVEQVPEKEAVPVAATPRQTAPIAETVTITEQVSSTVAPIAAPRDTGSSGGSGGEARGNGIGALDPNVRGVRPDYTDARVWEGPAGRGGPPGRTGAENLDSIIRFAITSVRDSVDSLARAQGRYDRAGGDWTKTGKDGEKWGWDQKGIRLGKVTIPNALLALLPLNSATAARVSGNPTRIEADRRLAASRADILRISERSLGDSEFRRINTELRDRREKERRDRLRAPSAAVASPVRGDKQ